MDKDSLLDLNNPDKPMYSFEIEESFDQFAEKISKSAKNGLIKALAQNEYFTRFVGKYGIEFNAESINAYGNTCDEVRDEGSYIVLRRDRSSCNPIDSHTDAIKLDESNIVIVEPNGKDGCIVSGDVGSLLLHSPEDVHNIFTGVRSCMTYKPDTFYMLGYDREKVAAVDDTFIKEQEKRKLNLRDYKNELGNRSFEQPLTKIMIDETKKRLKKQTPENSERKERNIDPITELAMLRAALEDRNK